MSAKAVFITGTDTGAGKTLVSTALMEVFKKQGLDVSGYKPVASGSEETQEGIRNSDAMSLIGASNISLSYEKVNPYPLQAPLSPYLAAELEHVKVDFSVLDHYLELHYQVADKTVIEGAGGWRVPVQQQTSLSTWVKSNQLPIILVIGVQLGCINHALLTAQAVQQDGLKLMGWIANRVNPATGHYHEIIQYLEDVMPAPKLGEIPYLNCHKRANAYQYIDVDLLMKQLEG